MGALMEWNSTPTTLGKFERLLLVLGLLLLSVYAVARVYQTAVPRAEMRRFWQAQGKVEGQLIRPDRGEPGFRLWSPQRIAAYKASVAGAVPTAIAVLRIPSVNLEVPVLEGTDEVTLNQGVGHIGGTAGPDEAGNIGIAGHRDGFFRGLKDIQKGDTVDLATHKRTDRYAVDETLIVSPDDVSVLRPRGTPSLTLVTCYPFYFVGSAPQRFIVHASISNPVDRTKTSQRSSSVGKEGGPQN